MADINITTDTLVSALTPPGGNPLDTYYVSNGASLIVNTPFVFLSVVLGQNSSGAASAGFLVLRPDARCSGGFIFVYGLGEVKDDVWPNPTLPSVPAIFQKYTAGTPLNIRIVESGGKWTPDYYVLVQPVIQFDIYRDLYTFDNNDEYGVRIQEQGVDTLSIREAYGGSQYEMQNRYGKRPRFFALGLERQEVAIEIAFNTQNGFETSLYRQCRRAAENGYLGTLITDKNVWTRMRFVEVSDIRQEWRRNNFRVVFTIKFVEDEV